MLYNKYYGGVTVLWLVNEGGRGEKTPKTPQKKKTLQAAVKFTTICRVFCPSMVVFWSQLAQRAARKEPATERLETLI